MESIDSAQDSYDGTLQTLPVIDQTGTTAPAPLTPKDLNVDNVQIRDFSLDKPNDSGLKESFDESHDNTTSSDYAKRLNLAPSTPIKEIEPINSAEAEYMRKEAVSAENLAAIESVLQGTPRPRRSAAGKKASYVPNCSPGGTEKKSKQNSRKTKQKDDESPASTSSNVKTKVASQERSVEISSDVEKVSSRKETNKKRKSTDTSDQNEALVVIDPQDQNDAVVPETGRKATKASKASTSKTSKRSTKISEKDRLDNDSQSQPQPNSTKEISSDEEAPVSRVAKRSREQEDKTKLDVLSSSDDSDANDNKETEHSQMGTKKSKIASKVIPQKTTSEKESKSSISQMEKKKNNSLSGSFHGKPLDSLLSSFSYGRARHPGLGRKISVPTLHRNRQDVNPRKQRVILLKKEKKKREGNNQFSDDEMDANNFKQRPNESYEQYLLRVCDEEGTYKAPPQSEIQQDEGYGDDWKDDGIVSNHEEAYEE